MSVGISRLSNATEKFSNLAGKISAAKSAMLNSIESETGKEETPFAFSRPILKEVKSRDENAPLHDDVSEKLDAAPEKVSVPDAGNCDEPPMLFEIETEARTEFLNTHIKDKIMARWELMDEEGPSDDFADEMSVQDLSGAMQETMPLMLGYHPITDYIELEYMVMTDPQTGESVSPVATVEPSEDGKAGNIYLNGKLAACVAGAQDLQASDVKLVQAKA
jgi:hypothetical protein